MKIDKKVQLRYIEAIHSYLRELEKEIEKLPISVDSASEMHVVLYCYYPHSIEPRFIPKNKDDKVMYTLAKNFPHNRFRVALVPEPSPHLTLGRLDDLTKTYHFYAYGDCGENH